MEGLSFCLIDMFKSRSIPDISHNHTTSGGVLFSIENAKFWPLLANLGDFVVNFWCTSYRPK